MIGKPTGRYPIGVVGIWESAFVCSGMVREPGAD